VILIGLDDNSRQVMVLLITTAGTVGVAYIRARADRRHNHSGDGD
jgi:hypothetical protein